MRFSVSAAMAVALAFAGALIPETAPGAEDQMQARFMRDYKEAVVRIRVSGIGSDGQPAIERIGSGVIVHPDGQIVTAQHVVGEVGEDWQSRTIMVDGIDGNDAPVMLGEAAE